MVGCSVFTVLSAIFNFMATQNLPLPVRQPLNVTGMVYMVIIEVTIFSLEFTNAQICLLVGIVLVQVALLLYFCLIEIPKEKAREE